MLHFVELLGIAGSIASIFALIQVIRDYLKNDKKKAIRDAAVFAVLVLSTSFGYLYIQNNKIDELVDERQIQVTGLLYSAQSELSDSINALRIRLIDADHGLVSPLSPRMPKVLEMFAIDGELFSTLSMPMKKRLPQFIKSNHSYQEAYSLFIKEIGVEHPQVGTISLMLSETLVQSICVELEILFQNKEIDELEHKERFYSALSLQVQLLKSGITHSREIHTDILPIKKFKKAETSSFWVGFQLSKVTNIRINKTSLKSILNEIQTEMFNLGLNFNIKKLFDEKIPDGKKLKYTINMISEGIFAIHGKNAFNSFSLGLELRPTMQHFSMYVSNYEFRKQLAENNISILSYGEVINELIDSVNIPTSIKKLWNPLYQGLIPMDINVTIQAQNFEQEILSYFLKQRN